MGKLITIPTAVGWRSDETIQLTVVHRHHKINFCQKITLFPFNYSFTIHREDATCKMDLYSVQLPAWIATIDSYVQHGGRHQCLCTLRPGIGGTSTEEEKDGN